MSFSSSVGPRSGMGTSYVRNDPIGKVGSDVAGPTTSNTTLALGRGGRKGRASRACGGQRLSVAVVAIETWWDGDGAQRFWMEAIERPDLGEDLVRGRPALRVRAFGTTSSSPTRARVTRRRTRSSTRARSHASSSSSSTHRVEQRRIGPHASPGRPTPAVGLMVSGRRQPDGYGVQPPTRRWRFVRRLELAVAHCGVVSSRITAA